MSPSDDSGRWAVYDEHAPAIHAYVARRVERDAVDDVVADTFAIAWRRLPREADPLPWLYAVARRAVHGHRRSTARRGALVARVLGRERQSARRSASSPGRAWTTPLPPGPRNAPPAPSPSGCPAPVLACAPRSTRRPARSEGTTPDGEPYTYDLRERALDHDVLPATPGNRAQLRLHGPTG